MTKAKKLRALFNKEGVIRIAESHDGITAKLVEFNGFDGVWASGFEVSTSYAVPDANNILTMTQYLQAASVMNDAVSIRSNIKGYKKEMINYPGLKYYINDKYRNNNILNSLFYAEEEMDDEFVVCYSDILFGKNIMRQLKGWVDKDE